MNDRGKKLQINGLEKLTYKQNRWLDNNWKILRTFSKDTAELMGPTLDINEEPLEYPIYGIIVEHQVHLAPNVIEININSEIKGKGGHLLLPYVDIEIKHIRETTTIHNTTLPIEMFYDMDTFRKHLLHMIEKVTTI